jgi:aminomethyltransferase
MELKKTALYEKHIAMGAKMVEFAGYDMPVRYSSLIEEHMAVRESVGVFDVSHMGEFWVEGKGALDLIQKISSNDASVLNDGEAQYSCMPNSDGGIIDDLIIYRITENQYMLVVNASNMEKDWNWINSHNTFDARLTNRSEEMSLLAVQGPKAAELLQSLTDIDLSNIKYYNFTIGRIADIDNTIISATGYTGSGGFELYVRNEDAPVLWEAIFNTESDIKVLPAGLGARDTLRLEKGFCLYGNDIDDTTSPLEAGLGWITKLNHDFVNSMFLQDQKANGVTRRLIGFVMDDKGIPRQGYDILSENGDKIGHVTSGTHSPQLDKGIGMGYVNVPHHKSNTRILIQIRKNAVAATVTKTPFV